MGCHLRRPHGRNQAGVHPFAHNLPWDLSFWNVVLIWKKDRQILNRMRCVSHMSCITSSCSFMSSIISTLKYYFTFDFKRHIYSYFTKKAIIKITSESLLRHWAAHLFYVLFPYRYYLCLERWVRFSRWHGTSQRKDCKIQEGTLRRRGGVALLITPADG